MTFLRLKNDRIRVSLTRDESEQLFGSKANIDKNDPRTQIALRMLLKRVLKLRAIPFNGNSVWVEITKNISGGYDVYFIKCHSSFEDECPVLTLEFKDIDSAVKAARSVFTLKGECVSSFYKFYDQYRIIAKTKRGLLDLPGALEFADRIFYSVENAAETFEHGKELIALDAIEALSVL